MRTRILMAVAAVTAALLLAVGALANGKTKPHPRSRGGPRVENRVLFAVLNGRNEISPGGRRGAGDPDGRGSFTAIVDGNQLCFGITVKNLDTPVAAHIHKARINRNGPIVVALTAPASGDPGASSGCVTVDPTLARQILTHPRQYYANVHTTVFPAGAARGQLAARSR